MEDDEDEEYRELFALFDTVGGMIIGAVVVVVVATDDDVLVVVAVVEYARWRVD